MVCAAARPAKSRGGKSTPEKWLVNGVCCRAHACSKNHSYIMEAAFSRVHSNGAGAFGARPTVVEFIMVDGFLEHPCTFGHMLKNNHLSGGSWRVTFWSRIGSSWLPTARYPVRTKRNTSTKLFKHLPSPRDALSTQKIKTHTSNTTN